MAGPYRIDVFRHVPAPIEVVWDIISNHRQYTTWTPVSTARLEVEGSPHPDGIGAIRFLGTGNIGAREQVIEFEPPRHMAYVILGGLVRDYRADMWLEETSDGGTDLRWQGSFESAPIGVAHANRKFLEVVLRDTGNRIVREAVRRVAPESHLPS